jgi:hypothetical protein
MGSGTPQGAVLLVSYIIYDEIDKTDKNKNRIDFVLVAIGGWGAGEMWVSRCWFEEEGHFTVISHFTLGS